MLFLLSLALVLLFTRMIIGPVKGIERMINQLGAGKSLDDAALFTGPRELRSVGKRIIWLSERLAWLESQRHQFLRHLSHELKPRWPVCVKVPSCWPTASRAPDP